MSTRTARSASGSGGTRCSSPAASGPSRSLTRFPVSPGHCLVIPRRHEPDFFELSREEQEDIWEIVWELRELLEAEHDTTSFNVGINAGEAAGQIVAARARARDPALPRRRPRPPRRHPVGAAGAAPRYWES